MTGVGASGLTGSTGLTTVVLMVGAGGRGCVGLVMLVMRSGVVGTTVTLGLVMLTGVAVVLRTIGFNG